MTADRRVPPPRNPAGPYRVCTVCLGNICRSPTAQVLLRTELASAGLDGKVTVDSRGTGDWHLGDPMHPGMRDELERRGLNGSGHTARQIERSELAGYDLLLAMDARNLADLRRLAGRDPAVTDRIRLMLSFDPAGEAGVEVPDPYYGSEEEFIAVVDLLEPAARELARQLAELL